MEAKLRARAGREKELEALLKRQVGAVRANEPDCLAYRLHRLTQDPTVFLFYEQYRSCEQYRSEAAFEARRYGIGREVMQGPPRRESWSRTLTSRK